MPRLTRRSALVLSLITSLALLAGAFYVYSQLKSASGPAAQAALPGGDFTLESAAGPVSLSDYRGQAVVLMFGYTSCPDVCPTSLARVAAGLNQLTEAQQRRVQPIFISVDPDRDTPAKLATYVNYFHPRLVGVTGTKAQIDAVTASYGAFYRLAPLEDSALGYSVDHSTRIYLLDAGGRLQTLLYHDTPPGEIAAALQALL